MKECDRLYDIGVVWERLAKDIQRRHPAVQAGYADVSTLKPNRESRFALYFPPDYDVERLGALDLKCPEEQGVFMDLFQDKLDDRVQTPPEAVVRAALALDKSSRETIAVDAQGQFVDTLKRVRELLAEAEAKRRLP